jgi:hypothetical protein
MNWTEHYDEVNDLTWEIPEIALTGLDQLKGVGCDRSTELWTAVLSALYNGIRLDCTEVPVFAVAGSDSVVTLQRADFAEKIERAIEYFLEVEEYEVCQCLQDLKRFI